MNYFLAETFLSSKGKLVIISQYLTMILNKLKHAIPKCPAPALRLFRIRIKRLGTQRLISLSFFYEANCNNAS